MEKTKRKKPVKCSALSKKNLESRGWIIDKCEQRLPIPPKIGQKPNPFANVTRDLFNMFDYIGIAPYESLSIESQRMFKLPILRFCIVGIQVTDHTSHSKRREKILGNPIHKRWKDAGGLILIQSWGKQGQRGQEKVMTLREEWL